MRNAATYLLTAFIATQALSHSIYGENENSQILSSEVVDTAIQNNDSLSVSESSQKIKAPTKPFTAFTAKALKNKVRIRVQPSLDAPILRELNKGDLYVVVGESDDFYAIQAPSDIKGYVFRTYVLDNVIEGNRVNVRLEPNLESPIIAQLHTGDKINGQISTANNKWLEIAAPESTRFYIAKEFLEKIGDANLKVSLDKKKEEGTQLLNSTFATSQTEMRKVWNQINLDGINANLSRIVRDYPEFPELQGKARELLTMIQESYLQKKMEYLESLAKKSEILTAHNKELSSQLAVKEQRLNAIEQTQNQPKESESGDVSSNLGYANPIERMNSWLPVENKLYENWSEIHDNQPISTFYEEQTENATTLKGIIQPYDRIIRNKPGDFVLLNSATRVPMAYLYSTQINLQEKIGKEVTVKVSPRDNNNFAYPAYFVLSIE